MSGLSKDELGFVRARGYGRTSRAELNQLLNVEPGEQVYVSTVENGVRTSKPLDQNGEVKTKGGDTFSVGPRVTKAAFLNSLLEQLQTSQSAKPVLQHHGSSKTQQRLQQEIAGLKRAGFGWAEPAQQTGWGWMVRLKGVTLPNGVRTDAMVLVPDNYPLVSPIGFYVKQGAATAKLDTSHLFEQRAYHGAVNLSEHGWQWFCGIAEGWKPGKHTLVSYINIVFMLFNDQRR
ncbi:MAG: hypothetical protein PHY54_03945 [Methylococcales bacterium]|nr:hypothetical protein [Methylococcales bacterium]